jgi:RNA polymerase sigma-70 factor (ECF subfamily)
MIEDPLVLARARRGDLGAFNDLVLIHQDSVYRLCLRMLASPAAAEDTTQDTFLSAWQNIGRLRGERFRPWLLRIAANLCLDRLRRQTRRPARSLESALEEGMPEPFDPSPAPDSALLTRELRNRIEIALAQLPPDQRLAVVLSDVEDLDYQKIATVMKTSIGTVKSRISRGRSRLRELLRPQLEPLSGAGRPE